jgi:hypothetical protein
MNRWTRAYAVNRLSIADGERWNTLRIAERISAPNAFLAGRIGHFSVPDR